jgi:hypothetical protein
MAFAFRLETTDGAPADPSTLDAAAELDGGGHDRARSGKDAAGRGGARRRGRCAARAGRGGR